MKRMISLCCAGLMAFSLAACGSQNATSSTSTPQVTSSVVGKITALDGTTATLQLGELTENQPGDPPSQDGTQPSGDNANGDSSASGQPQTPPEKPEGESSSDSSTQTPPAKPEGDNNTQGTTDDGTSSTSSTDGQNAPPSDGQGPAPGSTFTAGEETTTVDLSGATVTKESQDGTTDASLSDLAVGDVIEVTMGDDNTATAVVIKSIGGAPGGAPGGSDSGEVDQGTSANTIDKDTEASSTTYTSDGDDENALRVTGATATLNGVTVNKSGGASSNPGNGDFYGTNAALLATDGATVTIKDATITSNAQGGNGVFSYGKGTTVNISDSTITTQKDNSGGIQTTGGGTTNATNLTVETNGNSSAAIRSDRGGGTVNVEKGTYTSKGYNSPAVYSTADITVKNATLTAENSEALVVEGKNSITLENCDVSGNMSDSKGTSSSRKRPQRHDLPVYDLEMRRLAPANFSMTGGKPHQQQRRPVLCDQHRLQHHPLRRHPGEQGQEWQAPAGHRQLRLPRLGYCWQKRRTGDLHGGRTDHGRRHGGRLHLHPGSDLEEQQHLHRHHPDRGQCRWRHRRRRTMTWSPSKRAASGCSPATAPSPA